MLSANFIRCVYCLYIREACSRNNWCR